MIKRVLIACPLSTLLNNDTNTLWTTNFLLQQQWSDEKLITHIADTKLSTVKLNFLTTVQADLQSTKKSDLCLNKIYSMKTRTPFKLLITSPHCLHVEL